MVKATLALGALLFAAMQGAPVESGNFSAELVSYDDGPVNGYADADVRGATCRRDFEFYGTIDKKKTELGQGGRYRWLSMGGVGRQQGFSMGQSENYVPVKLVVPVEVALGKSTTVTAQLEVTKPEHVYSPEVTLTFACRPK